MNLRSTPLVGLSGVDQSSAVVIFHQHLRAGCQHQSHTFQQVLNFAFKRPGFQPPPPSIKRIQTESHGRFFVSLCLCLPFANHEWSALSSATKNKKSDEKERPREKSWRARRQLLAFGPNAILVCGPKAILALSFPLLLAVHCTCAGEKEVKQAQDSQAF